MSLEWRFPLCDEIAMISSSNLQLSAKKRRETRKYMNERPNKSPSAVLASRDEKWSDSRRGVGVRKPLLSARLMVFARTSTSRFPVKRISGQFTPTRRSPRHPSRLMNRVEQKNRPKNRPKNRLRLLCHNLWDHESEASRTNLHLLRQNVIKATALENRNGFVRVGACCVAAFWKSKNALKQTKTGPMFIIISQLNVHAVCETLEYFKHARLLPQTKPIFIVLRASRVVCCLRLVFYFYLSDSCWLSSDFICTFYLCIYKCLVWR